MTRPEREREKMKRHDYIIHDMTSCHWPGCLPYRGPDTAPGRGYPTREAAQTRLEEIERHYAARMGQAPGDLRIVERSR